MHGSDLVYLERLKPHWVLVIRKGVEYRMGGCVLNIEISDATWWTGPIARDPPKWRMPLEADERWWMVVTMGMGDIVKALIVYRWEKML